MPSVVIRLEPEKLANPDADMRYEIPSMLQKRSDSLLQDDGYEYERETNAMLIFLKTEDLSKGVPLVIAFLESERLHDNNLALGAKVGISDADPVDAKKFKIVYPEGDDGYFYAVEY